MRFAFAIAALVLSGILLILGIGQRTFLAGPAEIAYRAELSTDTGFAVIPGDVLEAVAGQANVEVFGPAAFAATGSAGDVAAWVEPFTHTEISVDPEASALSGATVQGVVAQPVEAEPGSPEAAAPAENAETAESEILDPRGSDLWIDERALEAAADENPESDAAAGTGTIRMPLGIDAGDAVLVSIEPGETGEVALVWVQDQRTPLAGPLLALGGILAVVGAVLYLLAVDHDRRGLGPRRGRTGPLLGIRDALGRRRAPASTGDSDAVPSAPEQPNAPDTRERRALRRLALPAVGLSVMLSLSGCSADYWPDFSPEVVQPDAEEPESAVAPVPVTRAQIDRIVSDIAAVAGEADDALDADLLVSRFTGDALAQRTANYTVRQSVPDYAVVPPRLTDEALGYELVQSTEGWPRTVFVTVASESADAAAGDAAAPEDAAADAEPAEEAAASPSLAIIMTQSDPHENFLVSRVISLRGGITMPEAAPAEEGTALLSDDLKTLAVTPGEVGTDYAAVLTGGVDVPEAELFDLTEDTLIERSGAAWAAQSQATADAAGQGVVYSVTAEQADSKIISLSTGVGGALVATTIIESRIEEPGSSRWKPTPPASVTALTGLSGQQDRLVSEVQHQLLFFVPSKSSNAPIQLLGFTSDLIGARN